MLARTLLAICQPFQSGFLWHGEQTWCLVYSIGKILLATKQNLLTTIFSLGLTQIHQTKSIKQNLLNQRDQTKPTKLNLEIQIYQAKCLKCNDQIYQTKSIRSNLQN